MHEVNRAKDSSPHTQRLLISLKLVGWQPACAWVLVDHFVGGVSMPNLMPVVTKPDRRKDVSSEADVNKQFRFATNRMFIWLPQCVSLTRLA